MSLFSKKIDLIPNNPEHLNDDAIWLGYTDAGKESVFVDRLNRPLLWANWIANEPNNDRYFDVLSD